MGTTMDKPFFCENSPAMIELESMVDKVGLANVLYALENICHGKAEHLLVNWQDAPTAKGWTREATRMRKCAMAVQI